MFGKSYNLWLLKEALLDMKSLLDALAYGGAYEDDSQIDRLLLIRRHVLAGGKIHLLIEPYEQSIDHRPSAALHVQSD